MKPSLRLLCGLLLTAFALSGCAEQILDSASKNPAPTVTSGEENLSVTLAEFSTDFGRVPQPSDLVLATLNDGLEAAGLDRLTGVNKNIPIRIPFSGPLANLYNDNGTWNSTNGLNLAMVFAVPSSPLVTEGAGSLLAESRICSAQPLRAKAVSNTLQRRRRLGFMSPPKKVEAQIFIVII